MSDEMSSPSPNVTRFEEYRERRGGGPSDSAPAIAPNDALRDSGNARRFAEQHGGHVRYCGEWKRFLVWDECRWVFDTLGQVWRCAEESALSLFDDESLHPDYQVRAKFAGESCDSKRQKAMVDMARWRVPIPVRAADFDRNPFLFNSVKGTVDCVTGEVYEPRREDLLLKSSAVVYDQDAKCPRWESFLARIFAGDEKLIAFLRRAIGYSLTGSVKERALFILYGNGRNGKSTLIETIHALAGDYGSVAPIELLTKQKFQTDSDRLFAPLTGVRFLSVAEPEQNDRLAIGRIKRMTGNDTLVGRFLYGEQFKFRPQFKLWLLTNHQPNLSEVGDAAAERMRLIPFTVEIPKEEIDYDLLDVFLGPELPGIFNWALEGLREWREHGLGDCPAVSAATAKMIAAADLVQRFVEECCTVGPLQEVPSRLFYRSFTEWCKDAREYPVKQSDFTARLKSLYKLEAPKVINEKRTWVGVGLNGTNAPGAAAVAASNKSADEWDEDKPLF